MVVRTAMLSLAYVPGRDKRAIDMSPSLEFVSARLRDTICPAVETVLLVALIVWARRRGAKWWPYDWPRRHPEPAPEPRKVVASGNSS
jgi:hypothetical protein